MVIVCLGSVQGYEFVIVAFRSAKIRVLRRIGYGNPTRERGIAVGSSLTRRVFKLPPKSGSSKNSQPIREALLGNVYHVSSTAMVPRVSAILHPGSFYRILGSFDNISIS
jgi:hypothetical protein